MYKMYISLLIYISLTNCYILAIRKYTKQDLTKLREEVREMFDHAYSGYIKYAYPYDELRPLTCDGIDTWGSYSLTLIDALDTLAVMGNYSEFRRVVDIVTATANFDANINVSVFETNIRIVGGLLSAHLFSQRAGIEVEPGWPCNGPLLRLAEDVAQRLLPAFNTKTGMPLGTVNLRYGVPSGETPVTCTAGVGTFILEFATLSRLTGDPIYEEVAMNALRVLFLHRSPIGLFGNHIDVMTGRWIARDSGIGAGVDSYLEYLVKGSILFNRPELMAMFSEARQPIDKYLRKNHWYVWASMHKGQVTLPVFQSLEAYWPGVLTLIGDIESALRSMHNYNSVWKQYGFTPEFYNIAQGEAGTNRESYPLRPELAESAMYLYRATGDPFMLDIGLNILRSIQHSAKTPCGYATIKDTRDHTQENRMESFFLAETTKYLYLLFDPDNFIHNKGEHGRVHTLPSGKQCILDSGGYIFNTEAHPIDPGALNCCYDWEQQLDNNVNSFHFKGESFIENNKQKKKHNGRRNEDSDYDKHIEINLDDENIDVSENEKNIEVKSIEKIEVISQTNDEADIRDDQIIIPVEADDIDNNDNNNNLDSNINEELVQGNHNINEELVQVNNNNIIDSNINDELVPNNSSNNYNNLLNEIKNTNNKLLESILKLSSVDQLANILETKSKNKDLSPNLEIIKNLHLILGKIKNKQTLIVQLLNKITNFKENDVKYMKLLSNDKNNEDFLENMENDQNLNAILNEIKSNHFKIVETLQKFSKTNQDNVDGKMNFQLNNVANESVPARKDNSPSNTSNGEENNQVNITSSSVSLTKENEPTFHQSAESPAAEENPWTETESNLSETPSTETETQFSSSSSSSSTGSSSEVITLSDYVRQLVLTVPSVADQFDPQQLLHNIRQTSASYINETYTKQYQLLTCKAQPFLIRITIAGEFLTEK